MVNATQMAKPFGKRPAKWLELPSTKEYINKLKYIREKKPKSENRTLAHSQLITSIKGGNDASLRGVWMHEDVALEFA